MACRYPSSGVLASTTMVLPAGNLTSRSGRRRPSSPTSVVCEVKSQYSSMPAISTTRRNWISPQRPRALGVRSAVTSLPVSPRNCDWVSIRLRTGLGFLEFLDLVVPLVERFAPRGHHVGDGLLAQFQIAARGLLSLGQGGAGQFQEGLAVAGEGVGGERLEGVGELLPRVFEERQFLVRALALGFQARL